MKAVGYIHPTPVTDVHGLLDLEVPMPVIGENDLLVAVRAIGVNPVDYKIRNTRPGAEGAPVILGWDAAGVVTEMGSTVQGFAVGDEVYYAGDASRNGSNAQFQAVDHRIVAHKPKSLSFVEAAALPLTAITATEMLFEQLLLPIDESFNILIIGGAGGVSSIAVQLVKALTPGRVFVTSGSDASRAWLTTLKVDGILDRSNPLVEEMLQLGIPYFDYVFSTTHTGQYLPQIIDILRPFGSLGVIDDPQVLDIMPFKRKSLRVVWEFMFAKTMHQYRIETQGQILASIAAMVDADQLLSTVTTVLPGLNAANVQAAHQALFDHTVVGKIVIDAAA